MADITTKTVSSLTSDSTLSETDAFVYGDAGGNTLKKSALSVLRNALFGAATLPSTLATSAKNVIGAINELNTKLPYVESRIVTPNSNQYVISADETKTLINVYNADFDANNIRVSYFFRNNSDYYYIVFTETITTPVRLNFVWSPTYVI